MKTSSVLRNFVPRQAVVMVLATAIAIPVWAQESQSQQAQPSSDSSMQSSAQSNAANAAQDQQLPVPTVAPAKEGFWGHLNPFARKSWVKKQTDPINDRLSELNEVNAKNANDIKDVASRAQAGIRQAQTSADAANQTATAAGQQAQTASNTAQQASDHVGRVHDTVNGLDQYKPVTDATLKFKPGTTQLTADSKQQLDDLAANLTGRMGYIVEIDAQSPGAGSVGIQSSQRLAEAVKRYLVTDHQIPVYRMHSLALGNVQVASNDSDTKPMPVRTRSVHVEVMENSLAAQATPQPHGDVSSTGPAQPQ